MVGRERVCVTCENPSPGPIKLLCYRWRPHGPFFPLLERLKTEENARLFSNGRVPVCTSCANYLQRQWSEYERKSISLPIEKRTYRLLSGTTIGIIFIVRPRMSAGCRYYRKETRCSLPFVFSDPLRRRLGL